jgi:hypothetical protein
MNALATTHDASVQMIDTSIVRVHQHGACVTRNRRQSMGRSRGGLTSKIHAVVDTNGLPVQLAPGLERLFIAFPLSGILTRREERSRISQEHIRRTWTANQRFVKVLLGGKVHNVLIGVAGQHGEEHANASGRRPTVLFWPATVRP